MSVTERLHVPPLTTVTLPVAGEAAMHALAATLARRCRLGDCILLSGDLGSGKTTFARGFIEALAPGCGDVVSPTFTLVQTYDSASGTIWHFDLYRLRLAAELDEIGLDEALASGITLIEWPQLAASHCPAESLNIILAAGVQPEQRLVTLSGLPAAWDARLHMLEEH